MLHLDYERQDDATQAERERRAANLAAVVLFGSFGLTFFALPIALYVFGGWTLGAQAGTVVVPVAGFAFAILYPWIIRLSGRRGR